jgi:multiple sugar transport system permease protein
MDSASKPRKLLIHVLLVLGGIVMVGPFGWMILTSLKSLAEASHVPPIIFPSEIKWSNYKEIFESLPFAEFYWNTFITTVAKTVGQLFLCSLAAYAFARIKFPGRNFFFILFLSVLMVPPQAFLIPQYQIIADLGLLNTLTALVLPGLFSAFGTFLLRQFFMSMPDELEEAAKIDGCNHFQIFWKIMLPLAKPGLIALAIFTIIWSWNDLLWPLIVNSSPEKMPLSAGLASLQGQYSTNYPILMAGTFLASWPLIVIFIFFQKSFVEGIALSGKKG